MSFKRKLTENRHDDDDEVEDVPGDLEVVPGEADQLHDRLHGEDGGEDDVDGLLDVDQLLGHVVVVDHHREHVEHDDDHDHDLECVARRQLVEEVLDLVL